jgi:hypothetical protein
MHRMLLHPAPWALLTDRRTCYWLSQKAEGCHRSEKEVWRNKLKTLEQGGDGETRKCDGKADPLERRASPATA